MKEMFLFVRHPYAAGIIGVIWIGSTLLYAMHEELPIVEMVTFNLFASFLIAAVGFRSGR